VSNKKDFDFSTWWNSRPSEERTGMALRAGTSDEYVKKFLLTRNKVPRLPLVKRLAQQMPKDSGITAEMLRNWFYPVK